MIHTKKRKLLLAFKSISESRVNTIRHEKNFISFKKTAKGVFKKPLILDRGKYLDLGPLSQL
jgi:hypothetical protein